MFCYESLAMGEVEARWGSQRGFWPSRYFTNPLSGRQGILDLIECCLSFHVSQKLSGKSVDVWGRKGAF